MKTPTRIAPDSHKVKNFRRSVILKLRGPVGEMRNNSLLGPLLGQHQINIMAFCNDFNSRSSELYERGVELPVRVQVRSDKTYALELGHPVLSFLLNQSLDGGQLPLLAAYDLAAMLAYFRSIPVHSAARLLFGHLASFGRKLSISF